MKKLMTLLGVMAFALGAFAVTTNQVGFESLATGNFDIAEINAALDPDPENAHLWCSAEEQVGTVAAYGGDAKYAYGQGNAALVNDGPGSNYLKLDAQSTLYRTLVSNGGVESITSVDLSDDLVVDTLVQFSSPTEGIAVPTLDDGVKFAISLCSDEEAGTTNLYVTAAGRDETEGGVSYVATNYLVSAAVEPAEWCRVTVRAVTNIYSDNKLGLGFVLYINGQIASCSDPDYENMLPVFAKSNLATYLVGQKQLFVSIVRPGKDAAKAIAAVGFKGSGSVDDITLCDASEASVAALPAVFKITWGEGIASFKYNVDGGAKTTVADASSGSLVFALPAGAQKVYVTDVTYQQGFSGNSSFELTVSDGDEQELVSNNVQIVGGDTYPTLAAAIAAARAGDVIQLRSNLEEAVVPEVGLAIDYAITLDLNGKTLTLTGDASLDPAFYPTTTFAIKSSVAGGKLDVTGLHAAVYNDMEEGVACVIGGLNDDYGVTIDGTLLHDLSTGGAVPFSIVRGSFTDSDAEDYVAEGSECTQSGNYYVVAPKVPTFVIQIVNGATTNKYETLEAAIADYENGDILEFLEDFEDLTGTTAVFNKAGTFVFAFNSAYMQTYAYLGPASGYNMTSIPPTFENLFYTYTVTEQTGVAKLIHSDDSYQWFDSFENAYSNATAGDSLLVKIDGNFNPNISSDGDKAFNTVTFETESTDPIQIATYAQGGGFRVYMTATNWVAPATATLTLSTDQTVASVAAGTLNVPSGVRLTTTDGAAFNGVSSLTGTGRIVVNGSTTLTTPSGSLQLLCQNTNWKGTLEIVGVDITSACNLTLFGNAQSTVCFNNAGCALTANNENAHAIGTLEIGPNGFELIGNYSAGVFTLPCAVTGTGAFKVSAKNSDYGTDTKDVKFIGNVSGFTGNITFDNNANARVVFGTGTYPSTAAAKCIIVTAGTEMTLPSAATWTAPTGIIVSGGLDVQGTLDVPASNLYGTGVVKFHDAAKAVAVAGSWTGTYRVAWNPGGNNVAFIIGNYCKKAGATVELMENINGAYPSTGSAAPNIPGTVKLSANWTINNGWYGESYNTTFAKLTGSGNLTVNGTTSGDEDIWYTFTTLENYTGTLGGKRGKFKIGTLVSAVDPQPGAKLVSLADGTREFRDLDSTVVKYNNETVEVELEQKSDGIYVAVPVTPAIDPDQGTTVDVDTTASEEDQRAEAQTKANAMDVAKTADASGVDQATWNGYFTKTVTKVGDDWVATAALNPAAVLPVDGAETTPLTDMLESVTAAALDDATPTAVPTKAGLYYWIAGATEAGATTYTPGKAKLGDGTTQELEMPTLEDENGKAFYKVCVGLEAPVTVTEP